MLLNELCHHWVTRLDEVLNTRINRVDWVVDGARHTADIDIDGTTFRLILEPFTYKLDGRDRNFLNVAFAKIVDGAEIQTLTGDNVSPSKILGAITNGLIDRLKVLEKQYEIDILVMTIIGTEEKRESIYRRIAGKMLGKLIGWQVWGGEVILDTGKAILIYRDTEIGRIAINAVQKFIKHKGY